MRISDWSSDVCSSDLPADRRSRFSTPFVECAGTRARRTRQSDRLGASFPGACQPLPTSERGDGKWKGRRTEAATNTAIAIRTRVRFTIGNRTATPADTPMADNPQQASARAHRGARATTAGEGGSDTRGETGRGEYGERGCKE